MNPQIPKWSEVILTVRAKHVHLLQILAFILGTIGSTEGCINSGMPRIGIIFEKMLLYSCEEPFGR